MSNKLLLAQKTWQLFGISHKDLIEMDPYDVELIKAAMTIYG
jgi:hypothetical protein